MYGGSKRGVANHEMSAFDARGVLRGKCLKCSDCASFTSFGQSVRCGKCNHSPVDHIRVPGKNPTADTEAAVVQPAASFHSYASLPSQVTSLSDSS